MSCQNGSSRVSTAKANAPADAVPVVGAFIAVSSQLDEGRRGAVVEERGDRGGIEQIAGELVLRARPARTVGQQLAPQLRPRRCCRVEEALEQIGMARRFNLKDADGGAELAIAGRSRLA